MKIKKILSTWLVICSFLLANDDYLEGTFGNSEFNLEVTNSFTNAPRKAITGWGEINLGMSFMEVREAIESSYPELTLKENGIADIPEDQNRRFLEIYSQVYINQLQMQFDENEKLFLIRIKPAPRFYSFSDLLKQLIAKYGEGYVLEFEKSYWETKDRKLELYKDNTMVYLDKTILQNIANDSPIERQKQEVLQSIINNF